MSRPKDSYSLVWGNAKDGYQSPLPLCGHSVCSQYYIDTGHAECIDTPELRALRKRTVTERQEALAAFDAEFMKKAGAK